MKSSLFNPVVLLQLSDSTIRPFSFKTAAATSFDWENHNHHRLSSRHHLSFHSYKMNFTIALLLLSAVFTAAVSDVPTNNGRNAYPPVIEFKLTSSSN